MTSNRNPKLNQKVTTGVPEGLVTVHPKLIFKYHKIVSAHHKCIVKTLTARGNSLQCQKPCVFTFMWYPMIWSVIYFKFNHLQKPRTFNDNPLSKL